MRHWPKWAAAAGTGGDEEGIRRKRVWALGAEAAGESEGAQRKAVAAWLGSTRFRAGPVRCWSPGWLH